MQKQQIIETLRERHEQFIAFVAGLDAGSFEFAPDGKWSAGQQLEHILLGVAPLATAFRLPKMLPTLIFGKSQATSRDYDSIVATYRQKLAEGGRATGRFIPKKVEFRDRDRLISKLRSTLERMIVGLGDFDEAELDIIRLPHPILGKLTIREMMYFTIYHVDHHRLAAQSNLAMING
jgi:hypothetical protein